MNHTNCLNCNHHLAAPYCSNCGQKASTHRYSVLHFIEHDLIHGILHIDKGLLYTIKALFTRPGHSIREFIQGKRVNHFNYVTLLIIILGVTHFISSFSPITLTDIVPESSKAAMSQIEAFSTKYPKALLLFMIPAYSIFTYLWFGKAKMNGTEHIVMNAYKSAGELILGILFIIITIFYRNKEMLYLIYSLTSGLLSTIYAAWFYYQYFSVFGYKKYSLLLRSIMVLVSVLLLPLVIGLIAGLIKAYIMHK
ncbi:MAG: DUF3667 domain-containing protein [Filimonas sp.]|nr:DUF3667 domain-containing protein [Filimonas sp.]